MIKVLKIRVWVFIHNWNIYINIRLTKASETLWKKRWKQHPTPVRMTKIKNTDDSLCWRGFGVREDSSISDGSADLYSHFANQYGGLSEDFVLIYFKTQQYHSWAYSQRMQIIPEVTFT